jgi:hypothetical protein
MRKKKIKQGRAYFCEECQAFHVTQMTPDEYLKSIR